MAKYRVICIVESTANDPVSHAHIIGVGTETTHESPVRRWTLTEVLDAVQSGDQFYTRGVVSQKVAPVVQSTCPRCEKPQIVSGVGFVPDNELSQLRLCSSV